MKRTLQAEKERISHIMRVISEQSPIRHPDADDEFSPEINKNNVNDNADELMHDPNESDFDTIMLHFQEQLSELIKPTFEKLIQSTDTLPDERIKNQMAHKMEEVLGDIYNHRPGGVYNPTR
jgi:hypothetical protein